MDIRFENSARETMGMNTSALRESFLIKNLMKDDEIRLTYSHYDRMIVGGVKPVKKPIELSNPGELKSLYFLERREMGIINVGGEGCIEVAGKEYALSKMDCLYLGKETQNVKFKSKDKKKPALYYLLSSPAHHKYPNRLMTKEKATPVNMGDKATCNERTIYKYIHLDGIRSCQLVMGLTILKEGSVWNSVPPHTHTRRMEVYFYFDLTGGHRVFHFMGEEKESRHIVMGEYDAVISPPWSMHFGCGTSNYGFIWGMAGENQVFSDMDQVQVTSIH